MEGRAVRAFKAVISGIFYFGIKRFLRGGGSLSPAFRAGFFVNICSEEGR